VRAPQFTTFTGIGSGFINGIAVGSEGGIFCTTAEDGAGVEFYHLATQTGLLQIFWFPVGLAKGIMWHSAPGSSSNVLCPSLQTTTDRNSTYTHARARRPANSLGRLALPRFAIQTAQYVKDCNSVTPASGPFTNPLRFPGFRPICVATTLKVLEKLNPLRVSCNWPFAS